MHKIELNEDFKFLSYIISNFDFFEKVNRDTKKRKRKQIITSALGFNLPPIRGLVR